MDVDLSLPEGAPPDVTARLLELQEELEEGDITAKGYRKHREQVLASWVAAQSQKEYAASVISAAYSTGSKRRQSGVESIHSHPISDIAVAARRLVAPKSSLVAERAALGPLQPPIPPRGIPDSANTDPLNTGVRLTRFDNMPSILRHRSKTNADVEAFVVLDKKGKECQSITWSKLASKAEKVGQMLRDQSGLFRGDRVVLIYADNEPIEFIIAMMGCFLAGLVAVPVSPSQFGLLGSVLQDTQCHLVLLTENQHKLIAKIHPEKLARLRDVNFWKTTEFGSYNPPKKGAEYPALQVPDLAYIDFTYSPTGDLRGVVMSHRTLLHQMMGLMAILRSRDVYTGKGRTGTDRLLCSLDMRRSTGLIIGVLLAIYAGNRTYFLAPRAMSVPGLYAHVVTRFRISILLSDYPALKQVCYNYQSAPQATRNFSKKQKVDLNTLRWCLIDASTVDTEFQMVLADRWLTPLGNAAGRAIVAPMLTLNEHGGMVIAMRDWLGDVKSTFEEGQLYLDRVALQQNKVDFRSGADSLAVAPFGFPLPDATVAIVDPETGILANELSVGELWIDSPSLSGGFWGLSEDTDATFHAHCYNEQGVLPLEFLRTGVLGFVFDGLVYVLGLLEDRLVYTPTDKLSPVESVDSMSRVRSSSDLVYAYSTHLVHSIMHSVQGHIYDSCIFQLPVGNELLPVLVLESSDVSPPTNYPNALSLQTKQNQVKEQSLDSLCSRAIAALETLHKFPVYCAIISWPNSIPRIIRAGRPDIAKLLARHQLMNGRLASAHVKFNLKYMLDKLPYSEDPHGGLWSPAISYSRAHGLSGNEKQYSGVDMRERVLDDRIQMPLDDFKSIVHLLQWRANRQPDELAQLTLGGRPADSKKETTWRKLDQRVAAVVQYLRDHLGAKAGDVACLIYTHGEDYIASVLACFVLGLTVIPISPINLERLDEDLGALSKLIKQFKVGLLLGNHETYQLFDEKAVSQYLKPRRLTLPKIHNTAKVKVLASHTCKSYTVPAKSLVNTFPALVWLYWSADHEWTASQMSHAAIMGMCKVQKETCQMTPTKPVIGCVRATSGLGFLYTVCLGIYVGSSTLLLSPVDYANNPSSYFVSAGRYKVKDGYATVQMLEHACKKSKPKGYSLADMSNLIVPVNGRADKEIVKSMRRTFGPVGLETVAINIAYGTPSNPMITTRSYMLVESIDIWLHPAALRRGYVTLVNPANCPNALHLQDSGMVPINTQVAIVNPETQRLCRAGEYGEIWVVSDGNQSAFYKRDPKTNAVTMNGVIEDGDQTVSYMRTGDLGFLHTVTKGVDMEMQVLFVLGPLALTIEVNGLQHFVEDIEWTVEQHHQVTRACAFSGNGLNFIIVETICDRKHLPSMGPVVVNQVLEEHEFALDVVVFVGKGKIPLSRLQEKQRKRLIQMYMSDKLSILSQYGVKSKY